MAEAEKSSVFLIPWDPDSSEHVKRLYNQRVACGWREDMVERWRGYQREGRMGICFVVLPPNDPTTSAKLIEHTTCYPLEASPLIDTATSLRGKPITPPSPPQSFLPIGHISLDSGYPNSDLADPSLGLYCISTLYISRALQSSGLGGAAMRAVESLATREPICARTLALNTMARENAMNEVRLKALGRPVPKMCNQDWYERHGYAVFKRVADTWRERDSTGKEWSMTDVYMKKNVPP